MLPGPKARRILVTGGAGYIGSVLCQELLARGYYVRVVDLGVFGTDHLPPAVELIHGDILHPDESWLVAVDAVINLAGLSNDPMANYSPWLNMHINGAAAVTIALMCKQAGISRFIQASSCSVYGQVEHEVDETHAPAPRYPYGLAKLMADVAIMAMADESFRPIALRKGTVCGWSPRMRFDLIVNTMVRDALTTGTITVHSPSVWRPLLDIRDAVAAYIAALEAPPQVSGIFNVAMGNFTVMEIALAVAERLSAAGQRPQINITGHPDPRSYRVSTRHAARTLRFHPSIGLDRMIDDTLAAASALDPAALADPRTINITWWQHWLRSHHLREVLPGGSR